MRKDEFIPDFKGPEDFSSDEVKKFRKERGPFRADEQPGDVSEEEVRALMFKDNESQRDPSSRLLWKHLAGTKRIVPSTTILRQN